VNGFIAPTCATNNVAVPSHTPQDVHQEAIDEINLLSTQALDAIAAEQEYVESRGWRGQLASFVRHRVLHELRVEEMFANEMFNLLDEDGSGVIDDYELDILRRALLHKLKSLDKVTSLRRTSSLKFVAIPSVILLF
jgi:hypothetical protein